MPTFHDRYRGFTVDPQGHIDEDVRCGQCGYNWRGLQTAGRCPECGATIIWGNTQQRLMATGGFAWLMTNLTLFLTVCTLFILVRPKFTKIFEDFDTDLPLLTKLMILPHWMVLVGLMLALAGGLVAVHFALRSTRAQHIGHTIVTMLIIVGCGFMAMMLFLPLVKLIQSVTG